MKKYIIIAGVNGAGKSTLYQTIGSFKDMERVNTDECELPCRVTLTAQKSR